MTLARRIRLSMVATSITAASVGAGAVTWTVAHVVQPFEEQQGLSRLVGEADLLASRVEQFEADGRALADGLPLPAALEEYATTGEPSAPHRAAIDRAFAALMRAKPRYLQVRLLGPEPTGHEIIRWERVAGKVVQTAPELLQDKGGRDYVRRGFSLPPGGVYTSPIELNREFGKIQVPHVPVLRVIVPVRGRGQRALGLVVINVDMGPLLAALGKNADPDTMRYAVRVSDGSFLIHPNASACFGRELGRPERLETVFPALAGLLDRTTPVVEERELNGEAVSLAAVPMRIGSVTRMLVIEARRGVANGALLLGLQVALAAGLATTLVAVLLASALGRSIVKPLQRLTEAVRNYRPDQELHIPDDAGVEVNLLARALRAMQTTISQRTLSLEQQRRAFQSLVRDAPIAMLVLADDFRIVLANRQAGALFGCDANSLEGVPADELVPGLSSAELPFMHTPFDAATPDTEAAPGPDTLSQRRNLTGLRRDGSEITLSVGLCATERDATDQTRLVISLVDVTLRERAERELRRSNEALAEFAFVASHDLQEPLRMMAAYADLLTRRHADGLDPQAAEYLEHIRAAAQRMGRLVEDLLSYSRLSARPVTSKPVPVRPVVNDVLADLTRALTDAHATVDVDPLPDVMGDPVLLAQVFQNLISNAIKFRGEADPHVTIRADKTDGQVIFEVGDNGIGVPPDARERIFQMFQRLHKNEYAGSGIGLAFARRIVEQLGGRMWCESTPGQGARFYFSLTPAATDGQRARAG